MLDDGSPLSVQIAQRLEELIAGGHLVEGERAPSTNQLAAFLRISPATVAEGLKLLIEEGLLEQRSLATFVTPGARERVLDARRRGFAEGYISPMVAEAQRLGIAAPRLINLVRESSTRGHDSGS